MKLTLITLLLILISGCTSQKTCFNPPQALIAIDPYPEQPILQTNIAIAEWIIDLDVFARKQNFKITELNKLYNIKEK